MFDQMMQIFKKSISKEQIAEFLNTTPEALAEFEKAAGSCGRETSVRQLPC